MRDRLRERDHESRPEAPMQAMSLIRRVMWCPVPRTFHAILLVFIVFEYSDSYFRVTGPRCALLDGPYLSTALISSTEWKYSGPKSEPPSVPGEPHNPPSRRALKYDRHAWRRGTLLILNGAAERVPLGPAPG